MNTNEKPSNLYTFKRPGGLGQISFEGNNTPEAFAQFYRTFPGHGATLTDVQDRAAAEARHDAQRAALASMGID